MLATTSPGAVHRRPPELGSARAAERAVYRPRNPTATPLYPIVQHHLETFLARAAEADPLGDGVAFWVENDFRAYLRCGILAHGFARARCDGCGSERLIAFSCRGRGVCPCGLNRLSSFVRHLAARSYYHPRRERSPRHLMCRRVAHASRRAARVDPVEALRAE